MRVSLPVGEFDVVALPVGVPVGDPDRVSLPETLAVLDGVWEADAPMDAVMEGVGGGVAVEEGVGVSEGLEVGLDVALLVGVTEAVALMLLGALALDEPLSVGGAEGRVESLAQAEARGVFEEEGETLGEPLEEGHAEVPGETLSLLLGGALWEDDQLGVRGAEGDLVGVALLEGVMEGVAVTNMAGQETERTRVASSVYSTPDISLSTMPRKLVKEAV